MNRFFITATGTNIGKTLVTAALTWQWRAAGKRVTALKPVISGFDERNATTDSDTAQLLAAQDLPASQFAEISPWRFAAPLSPDMAAKAENRELPMEKVITFCNAPRDADILLIEGVGGVMAPLTPRHTMLDWLALQAIPVILVTGSYLGTLSHTLTALNALKSRDLQVKTVIISESCESPASLAETRESLLNHTDADIRLMQRLDSRPEIWKNAPNLTEGLL